MKVQKNQEEKKQNDEQQTYQENEVLDRVPEWGIAVISVFLVAIPIPLFLVEEVDGFVGFLGVIVWMLLLLALLFSVFVRWTFVQESTAKMVMRSGAFHRPVFSKVGHRLQERDGGTVPWCELVPDPSYRYEFLGSEWIGSLLGGRRFYLWPLEEIYVYKWSFQKSTFDKIISRPDEPADFIKVGQRYNYGLEIKTSGFVDKDLVPLQGSFTLIAEIVNPRKALFDVSYWFSTFTGLVEPAIRLFVSGQSYRDLKSKINMHAVFRLPENNQILLDLKGMIGVNLLALECRDLGPTPEHQKLILEETQGNADAQQLAAETWGTLLGMICRVTKKTLLTIQGEFENDPAATAKKYESIIGNSQEIREFINLKLALLGDSYQRYDIRGGTGLEGAATIFAEKLRGTGGGSSQGQSSRGSGNPGGAGSASTKDKKGGKKDDDDDEDDPDEGWEIK